MSGGTGAPIDRAIVWLVSVLACAVASADTVFDCATCAVAAAAGAEEVSVAPGEASATGGPPVHAQFHTQLQSQAWLRAKLAAAPSGPVQVQFQIHWPATAAGDEIEEDGVELDPESGVEGVWEAIHDQIQFGPAVDSSATSLGRTLSVQTQFHVHGAAPVGT